MAYNKENLVKLGHLEALGQRVKEELASVFGGTGTEGRNE